MQKPDFHTICRFRSTHLDAIKKIFSQIVTFCYEIGLIGSNISIDGTMVKASASPRQSKSSDAIKKEIDKVVLQGSEYTPNILTQATTGAIVSEVAKNPNAIGYIGYAYLDKSVKALSLDGGKGAVAPSPATIKSSAYPLTRSLFMYTNGEPTGTTKNFIDFVMGTDGQKTVTEVGYIPLT